MKTPPPDLASVAALHQNHPLIFFLLLMLLPSRLLSPANAISFDYKSFRRNNEPELSFQGDAEATSDGFIELTRNRIEKNTTNSTGRVMYSKPIRLWDVATRNLTNFTTIFSFRVKTVNKTNLGADGLSFFIVPYNSSIPDKSEGGHLALFNGSNSSSPGYIKTVAVEFDTFPNVDYWDDWDPEGVRAHVGIDIGNITSVKHVPWPAFDLQQESFVNATVAYDASTTNLSAHFTDNDTRGAVSYTVDLRDVLPDRVSVGISATTGDLSELHQLLSWSFNSSLELNDGNGSRSSASPPSAAPPVQKKKRGVLAGVLSAVGVLASASGIAWFLIWRRRKRGRWILESTQEGGTDLEVEINNSELEGGRGPKSFTYRDLARATDNFSPETKLGRGGFGDVYKGVLSSDHGRTLKEVAIKRVSKDSRQGMKEYVSEVKIISRLRHRNLVQLVGWCHERGELLLVYEYMPNGSLDAHLYRGREEAATPQLPWPRRYGIAQGVAAALLYLHEEWEQCVVHRDVKPSNVMLDGDFNAKLGDFGLARLVDHGGGMQTTVLAGTMGYIAPECSNTGKASKESDVYSFGVVALEIACGRRPIEPAAPEGRVRLLDWVWGLYGRGSVLEAADPGLNSENVDKQQMERLMVMGLWCVHPDFRQRPTMKQVVSALSFETHPPDLPVQMPVPSYGAPIGFGTTWQSLSSSSSTTVAASSVRLGASTTGTTTASTGSDGSSVAATSPLLLSTH